MGKIARLLDIREHEITSCFMFSLLNFFIMAGIFLGRATRDSLFFIEVGAKWLPLVFVFNAIFLTGVSLFFSNASGRYSKNKYKLFSFNFWIFALAIAFFGIILTFKINSPLYPIIYWMFFIFCEIALFVMIRLFWFFAEDYFTEQQMKRLSPKFVGSGQIGIGIGGILTLFFVGSFGTEKMVFIWLGLVIVSIYVSTHILKIIQPLKVEEREVEGVEEGGSGGNIFDGLKSIKKSNYLKLFVVITICAFIVASIFDVVLAYTAESHFGTDVDKLTYFLGLITIFFGFGAAFVQFLLMSKLIRRVGVGIANLFSPVALTVGSIVLISSFTFIGAASSRILFLTNEYLFNQSIIVLIYSAIREEERGKVSFFIEGSIVNGAIGVAGVGLLVYAMFFPLNKLGYVALIFGFIMLVCSVLLIAEYKKILIENLGTRPPEDRNLMIKNALGLTGDKTSDKLIEDGLRSPDETTTIVTMNLIIQEKKDESNKDRKKGYLNIASNRIEDKNKSIRLAAIRMIIELVKHEEFKDEYLRSITEKLVIKDSQGNIKLKYDDRETINAILDVYTTWDIGITEDFETLLTYLENNSDEEIVGDLIIHLKDMGFMGIYNGIQMLNKLMESENPIDLKVANRVLGEYGEEAFHKDLTEFCSEKLKKINQVKEMRYELDQLQEIIKAFGKIGYKNDKKASEAFNLLIQCLKEPLLKKNAVQSLESLLEKKAFLFEDLKKLYEGGGWDIELIREVPGIMRSIKPLEGLNEQAY